MLKLPLCPYCGAGFLYADVRRNRDRKTLSCPHCGKTFRVKGKRNRALLFLATGFLLVWFDWFLLSIPSMNLTVLFAATVPGVAAAWLLIPYTVRYGPL